MMIYPHGFFKRITMDLTVIVKQDLHRLNVRLIRFQFSTTLLRVPI